MTVSVPLAILVLQWSLLVFLLVLLVLAYRQLAYRLEGTGVSDEADATLAVGSTAPAFTFLPGNHAAANLGSNQEGFERGRWTVLMFGDPLCISCERALSAIERLQHDDQDVYGLVVTYAERRLIEAVSAFRDSPVPIQIVDQASVDAYHVTQTPYLFIIDPSGHVKARGIADTLSGLQRLVIEARRRPLNDLQLVGAEQVKREVRVQ